MKALLIIDMQCVSFTPATPRYDAENVIKRINTLSEIFRENGDTVIFIQHDGSKENYCLPGTEEWKILPELNRLPEDVVIAKLANDSFYRTNLHQFLQDKHIDELVITGCATDFCVDSTVKSALTHDYNLTIIADAHTTADRPHLPAPKIIEHYIWIWENLIHTDGTIRIVKAEEYVYG
jgi:nicotinamidase-related amidase